MGELDYDKLLERVSLSISDKPVNAERFKLPAPKVKITGNRTCIQNFAEIADRCEREPTHLLKYLVRELATSGNLEGQNAIFTGKFGYELVKGKIAAYVKEFVKCPECQKPDTKIIKENRQPLMRCMACGAKHSLRTL
ncbi:MAG: translation initiation factor IF-2 subunit beta [archaeon]